MPFAWPTRGVRALGTAASVSEADISLNGQCAPPQAPPCLYRPAKCGSDRFCKRYLQYRSSGRKDEERRRGLLETRGDKLFSRGA